MLIVGGLDDGTLAHLHCKRGDKAVDRPIGVGIVERCKGGERKDRGDRLGVRGHLARDELKLGGLVAKDDDIGTFGHLGITRKRLPPHLGGQGLCALGDGIGHEHRAIPSTCKSPRHVPSADDSYLHSAPRLPTQTA